jgi:hypothetical protein
MNKLLIVSFFLTSVSFANEASVLKATVNCNNQNICSFNVTVKHKDTGWKHYANAYEILTMKREVIAKRILHHPHVNEQPFTRSISNVKVPKNTKSVIVRAHDLLHKYGGKEVIVNIK